MTPSSKPWALRRLSRLSYIPLAFAVCACSTSTPVILTANDCASLVPESWNAGVPGASKPTEATAGAWVAFGTDQTGQLEIANSRVRDAMSIVKGCEERDRKVAEDLKPKPWWHFGLW